MNTEQEIQEIDELFGDGWFNVAINRNKEIGRLHLEEQIKYVRSCSIHGQTSFFRDNFLIPILEHVIIPDFDKRPVKIAHIGCSDGREVYSSLIYFWKRINEFVLEGYDSNPEFVEKARAGGEGIPINSKEDRISKIYSEDRCKVNEWNKFGAKDGAYIVNPRNDWGYVDLTFTDKAKEKVNFKVHDIVKDTLPEKYDVIAMLNVLCHYEPKGREKILRNVQQSLTDCGWLICERYDSGSANAKDEYDKYMKDLSDYGFTKQTTIIPTWVSQTDDVSCWSRVYRKDSPL